MAVIAGINTTTGADIIATEKINPELIQPPSIVRCYEGFTWQADAKGAATHRFVSIDDAAVTGTKTESDELTATDFGSAAAAASPGVVGRRYFVTDEGTIDITITDAMVLAANDQTEKVRNRVDKDVLAVAAGATNTSNFTGEELTLDNFATARAAFDAQNPNLARAVMVVGSGQIAHLRKAIRNSGNGGLVVGAGLDVFAGRINAAYQGDWEGVEFWKGNVADANVSDASAFLVSCDAPGMKSGLALAVWWGVRSEAQRIAARAGVDVVTTARYGTVITAQFLVREIITKKAA